MLALYRSGRQAEALDAFQQGRRTLVEELGIDPSPRLQQLHAAILRQEIDLVPARAVPAQDHFEDVARTILEGRVVPVLGNDVGGAHASARAALRLPGGRRAGDAAVGRAVRRRDEGLGPALRRAPRAPRRRPAPHAAPSLPRVAPRTAPRARAATPGRGDDELRHGAGEGVRGGGRGRRGRDLSRHRPQSRPLLPHRAGRHRQADRGAEHLRHRALARPQHGDPQAPRPGRADARARVGELRRDRGRLHRLPRADGDRGRGSRLARGEAPPEPLPLPRLHDGRLEPPGRSSTGSGATSPSATTRGPSSPSRSRSSGSSGTGATSTCSSCRSRSTPGSSAATWLPNRPARANERRRGLASDAVQGARAVPGHRARCPALLRPRPRAGSDRGEPARVPPDGAVRGERGGKDIAPPRSGHSRSSPDPGRRRSSSTRRGPAIPGAGSERRSTPPSESSRAAV